MSNQQEATNNIATHILTHYKTPITKKQIREYLISVPIGQVADSKELELLVTQLYGKVNTQ